MIAQAPAVLRRLALAAVLAAAARLSAQEPAGRLLAIHDGARVLQPLKEFLEQKGHFQVDLADQAHLPADFSGYRAVLGYVHGKLTDAAARAIIDYTRNGGRFIALHHMISSGKAANRAYFDFLGLHMDHPEKAKEPVEPGGDYGWYNGDEKGVEITLVNLRPGSYVVAHGVHWPATIFYHSSDRQAVARDYPAIVLPKAEAYLNHKYTDGREKTVLFGLKYVDPRTHALFEQDTMGWYKRAGAGLIFYFQPGHFLEEYRNPDIDQMILNAIVWDGRE